MLKYNIITFGPHHFFGPLGLPPIASLHFRGGTPSKILGVSSTLGWEGQTGHFEMNFHFIANIIQRFGSESTSSLGEFKELAGFCTSLIVVEFFSKQ